MALLWYTLPISFSVFLLKARVPTVASPKLELNFADLKLSFPTLFEAISKCSIEKRHVMV